jgi:1-deoxy-D-xylulose-5-phosphate reductoisomerase
MRRKVSVFGATGSVGRNTVSLLREQGGAEAYEVVALTGAGNVALLAEQARELGARIAVTANPDRLDDLRAALAGSGIETAAGSEALLAAAAEPTDWAMSAIVGAAGLGVGLRTAEHGGVLALANKESLVCAGELLRATCARHGTRLIPVDSEHSAIFQALRGEETRAAERVILTASGGPFRDWPRERMATVTPAQARAHPNWDMGERISIDSATMFNKAMEMIEARALFDLAPERIEVIIHPQSIVHSMVGFEDGSILAQLGPSDMRGAIGFALNWPERRRLPIERLDFAALSRLDFAAADAGRFPALRIAREVMEANGLSGTVFNAAKEAALDAFLIGAIGFLDMAILVEHVLEKLAPEAAAAGPGYDLGAVLDLDATARRMSGLWVAAYSGK